MNTNTLTLNNAKATGNTKLSAADLADYTEVKPAQAQAPAPKPAPKLITPTAVKYLAVALDKVASPLHPNFRARLKPATLAIEERIRTAAARTLDAATKVETPVAVQVLAVYVGRTLKDDARTFITYWKNLLGAAAFAAQMDVVGFRKEAGSISPEQLDAGLDAMGGAHEFDMSDLPAFDVADAQRAAPPPSGPQREYERLAESEDDAYDAILAVQAWIGLAFNGIDANSRLYWGVDGLAPFGQRKVGEGQDAYYTPITDFDDYLEYQREQYLAKRRRVGFEPDIEDLMINS